MAGHMGARNRTRQNLEIVRTDVERGLLFVKGSVPGSKGGWLMVRDAVKLPRHPEAPYPAGIKSAANANQQLRLMCPWKPWLKKPWSTLPPPTAHRSPDHELPAFTIDGKAGADIDLNDDVFGVDPRADILHRVVSW